MIVRDATPKQSGGRDVCRYVPDGKNGGPGGAKDGYWKTKTPTTPWSRYDLNGNPITPAEAHPGNPQRILSPVAPWTLPLRFPFYPLVCPLCDFLLPQPGVGPS